MTQTKALFLRIKREPAVALAAFAALIQFLATYFFDWTTEQQGLINGLAVVVVGALTAWAVSAEKGFAFMAGVAQAVISLALGFGASITADQQTAIMAVVTTLVGLFVRTQVVAPQRDVVSGEPATRVTIQSQTGGSLN
jgi:nicotinamide riboside transporter PnuC